MAGNDTSITQHVAGGTGIPGGAYLAALDQIALQIGAQVAATTYNPVASYLFAGLPASPAIGTILIISDSNTAAWGANIGGGGGNRVLAWYNGSNFTVIGK